MIKAAVVQMSSTGDLAANADQAERLVREAAGKGASLVATPENTQFMGSSSHKLKVAEPLGGPFYARFSELARELSIHLVIGSFLEKSPDPHLPRNTQLLFGPDGGLLAAYSKIHLFDVDIADEVVNRESDTIMAGMEPVVAKTGPCRLGLSICYDLRFPELYGRLRSMGAEVITAAAAFTSHTGRAHWEVLVRARAIETQCFVLAPAQVGRHDDEGLRQSYGHSMIVDPWGRILAEITEDVPGVALADVDTAQVRQIRRAMPVWMHKRL